MFLKRKYSAIAIDAGSVSVAVCQLRRRGESLALHNWAVSQDTVGERPRAAKADFSPGSGLSIRARRMIVQAGLHGSAAGLCLGPPDVSFLPLSVPRAILSASRAEALSAIGVQAAREMSCDPSSLIVDYWPLPESSPRADKQAMARIMVAAAQSAVVERWGEFVNSLGLVLDRMDARPCAVLRAASRPSSQPPNPHEIWGVLDMGFSQATLSIACGDTCVFVRELSVTGDALTAAIVGALGIEYRDAEVLKRDISLAITEPPTNHPTPADERESLAGAEQVEGGGATWGLDLKRRIGATLRNRIKGLATEIEHAFSYVMQTWPDAQPAATALFICGGGANMKGLAETLSGFLGIGVQPTDPCRAVAAGSTAAPEVISAVHKPLLCASMGLAMGCFE